MDRVERGHLASHRGKAPNVERGDRGALALMLLRDGVQRAHEAPAVDLHAPEARVRAPGRPSVYAAAAGRVLVREAA